MMNDADCKDCTVGRVSGEGQGLFCPFIRREFRAGDVLFRAGEQADYVWFVKSGEVSVSSGVSARATRDDDDAGASSSCERKSSGSFVGLESLIRDRYDATARAAENTVLCGGTRAGFAQWLGPHSDRTCALLHDLLRVPEPSDNSSGEQT